MPLQKLFSVLDYQHYLKECIQAMWHQGTFLQVPSLDPATHAYSFWEGVPTEAKCAFGELFAKSETMQVSIEFVKILLCCVEWVSFTQSGQIPFAWFNLHNLPKVPNKPDWHLQLVSLTVKA